MVQVCFINKYLWNFSHLWVTNLFQLCIYVHVFIFTLLYIVYTVNPEESCSLRQFIVNLSNDFSLYFWYWVWGAKALSLVKPTLSHTTDLECFTFRIVEIT